jgi:asparagine synthase (glutamine-hydrolysing)
VIFGSIFTRPSGSSGASPNPIPSLSRKLIERILQSRGRTLVSEFWGYYVAALQARGALGPIVLRGPASPLACFNSHVGTLNIFFSAVDDYNELKLTALSVNWDAINAQVAAGDYLTHETAINEIETLECGEAMECGPDRSTKHIYWDPRFFLEDRSLGRFSEAASAIRETADYCIGALASEHRRALVSISGGLDSSIVLNALARSADPPLLTAVTYYSRGCGDERAYARSMAESVNCRLVESPRNDRLDLRCIRHCNLTARPVLNFSAPDVEARDTALARELGATAIFNGELGDNLFGSHPGPGVLLECIRRNRLGRQFFAVAIDYAILNRVSIWKALALARGESRDVAANGDFSSFREMQRRHGEAGAESILLASSETTERCRSLAGRFTHPWLKQARALAPGAHLLLFGLISSTSTPHHSPFSGPGDPLKVSPLVSQPLVEVALRIPGYLHCRGSQDRAVARNAYADVLPSQVLNRGLGKGGPNLWAKDVVSNNIDFLRDFLLDGILVQRGLIDREKLHRMLSPRIAKSTAVLGEIFAKLYIEAWLLNLDRLQSARTTFGVQEFQRFSA